MVRRRRRPGCRGVGPGARASLSPGRAQPGRRCGAAGSGCRRGPRPFPHGGQGRPANPARPRAQTRPTWPCLLPCPSAGRGLPRTERGGGGVRGGPSGSCESAPSPPPGWGGEGKRPLGEREHGAGLSCGHSRLPGHSHLPVRFYR